MNESCYSAMFKGTIYNTVSKITLIKLSVYLTYIWQLLLYMQQAHNMPGLMPELVLPPCNTKYQPNMNKHTSITAW